jgi:hypothetical protein
MKTRDMIEKLQLRCLLAIKGTQCAGDDTELVTRVRAAFPELEERHHAPKFENTLRKMRNEPVPFPSHKNGEPVMNSTLETVNTINAALAPYSPSERLCLLAGLLVAQRSTEPTPEPVPMRGRPARSQPVQDADGGSDRQSLASERRTRSRACPARPSPKRVALLEALQANPGADVSALTPAVYGTSDVKDQKACRAMLSILEKAGTVRRTGRGTFEVAT